MSDWKANNSYRNNSYKKDKKIEPYGFISNMRLYKDLAYHDKRLPSKTIGLLAYLIMHCDQNGVCFPSLSRIAKDQEVSRQAIQQRLNPLIKFGYLIKENRFSSSGYQTSNTYRLNHDLLKNPDCQNSMETNITPASSETCTAASLESCAPATSNNCAPAMSLSCTKKPTKIPDNKYSISELNEISGEVRKIVFEGLPPLEQATIFNKLSKQAHNLNSEREYFLFQINELIQYGLETGTNVHRLSKYL